MSLRLDDTGFGEIKIWQNPDAFCYGIDAVLLAGFAAESLRKRKASGRAMDLGTGTGIVPLILSHKTDAGYIGGIEIQRESFQLAQKNITENGLNGRLHMFCENVKDLKREELFGTFDVVTSNPPYTAGNRGIESQNPAKAMARHELSASLEDFVRTAAFLLRDRGDFYLVHRPSRLVDICESCRKHRLEPKELRFVSGKPMEKPNIVLVHCVKNGNRELKFLEPGYVHEPGGAYSQWVLQIYERA